MTETTRTIKQYDFYDVVKRWLNCLDDEVLQFIVEETENILMSRKKDPDDREGPEVPDPFTD